MFGCPKPQLFFEFAIVAKVALEYKSFQIVIGTLYLHARPSETFNVLPRSFFLVLDDNIQGPHGLRPLSSHGEVRGKFTAKLSP